MEQAEQFFTALYRLGKQATFVRYWGEGHLISSPANVRDMWHRIFQWLDHHLNSHNGSPHTAP
jgi:dipeptidyl aminopeptidase/acylaminoacyl peptidase